MPPSPQSILVRLMQGYCSIDNTVFADDPFRLQGCTSSGSIPLPAFPSTRPATQPLCRIRLFSPQPFTLSLMGLESASECSPPFTVFSVGQKRWIIFLAALSGMFSPMSSFIFYPAITSIARGLHVTVELVNLAITTYMIVSGIVPVLLGTAADRYGRRPIYILALSIYLVSNIGLALQNSFPALLVLRMLQSAGSSGTISLGYGVIADITTEDDRGSYVGILLVG